MRQVQTLMPKVRKLAEMLVLECKKQGILITVVHGLRTLGEQEALYAKGRTAEGEIVTNARSGYSFHNYGAAFDVCPLIDGKCDWLAIDVFKKIGVIGKELGLEWGGDWKSFRDYPHFQFTLGYSIEDFRNNRIDWTKFDIEPAKEFSGHYWLVKTEPTKYSWSDLVRDGKTVWDGVRNYQARNNLKLMSVGDLVLIYHSVSQKEIIGIARVARKAYQDPTSNDERWLAVDLVPDSVLVNPVSLTVLKKDPLLSNMQLIRQSRLSVCPLSKEEFAKVILLSK